jgi:uncharacterized protein
MTMAEMSVEAANFSWLLERFVEDTTGVTDTIAVSSDGLLLAAATRTASAQVEKFAAIVSGLNSLTQGAAECFGQEGIVQIVVEMTGAFLLIARISEGSCLGVIAEQGCDVGFVAYEMTLLLDRVGKVLTPELVHELQNLLVA